MQLVINLGPSVCNYFSVHALSGCGTTSYLYGKGKTRALSTLLSGSFPGSADVIGEIGISSADLMQAVTPFVTALYNQVPGISMEVARFNLFTIRKSPKCNGSTPNNSGLDPEGGFTPPLDRNSI